MKNLLFIMAAIFLFSCSGPNKTEEIPACCTEKCSKECIEICRKNNCTEKDCCSEHPDTPCESHQCKKAKAGDDNKEVCCTTTDECKEKCAKGECTETCMVEGAKEACCTKE